MPVDALELRLSVPDEALVRGVWDALRDAGLPSQADHRSPSNAPHITLTAGSGPDGVIPEEEAADLALAVERHAANRDPAVFRPWIPHVSLARRVPRSDLGGVLAAVAPLQPRRIVADRLLLWRPGPRTLTTLATAPHPRG